MRLVIFQAFGVNSQMMPFKSSVLRHTATPIDNKLYNLGDNNLGGKAFYLDVSVSFNTQELS
ncbi:hypothetical protein RhiirA5_429225 [Rhizophagus irregularis]|uniref:Uncharacterized protein n=1 Tax=Rhizophagus irregularis TaxID=588596 RepID=A0A2N0NYW3_9GLOM|nr:hypothetical protein RhiirA5_429225 [Rhizophagus irregularis]